jgi:lysophospholipase L1-like esterase
MQLPIFLGRAHKTTVLGWVGFGTLFAVAGVVLLLRSSAATPTASLETEQGSLTAPATIITSPEASNGSAVRFGTPAVQPTIKLMPLGDSITLGWNYYPGTSLPAPGDYRTLLWQKLVAQDGKKLDFVGSLSSGPSTLGDKDHQGHSGERIDQIRANIDTYMASGQPDIVLLMIGTNDVLQNYNLSSAPTRLQDLVDRMCVNRPNTHIVVSTIAPRPGLDSRVNTYNAAIPGVVSSSQGKGCRTSFFNMNSYMVASDMASSDNTHPTMAGYDKMAEAWYPFVTSLYQTVVANGTP